MNVEELKTWYYESQPVQVFFIAEMEKTFEGTSVLEDWLLENNITTNREYFQNPTFMMEHLSGNIIDEPGELRDWDMGGISDGGSICDPKFVYLDGEWKVGCDGLGVMTTGEIAVANKSKYDYIPRAINTIFRWDTMV